MPKGSVLHRQGSQTLPKAFLAILNLIILVISVALAIIGFIKAVQSGAKVVIVPYLAYFTPLKPVMLLIRQELKTAPSRDKYYHPRS